MQSDSTPPFTQAPKFVVDDSPGKASLTTAMSLMFFGITLAAAVLRLASAQDLNGIRALLMRDETISFLTAVWALVGPTFWLLWRSRRSWFKKVEAIEIVDSSPIAMRKSELFAEPASPPPTRARETTTRLVDSSALMTPVMLDLSFTQAPEPIFTYDAGTPIEDLKPVDDGVLDRVGGKLESTLDALPTPRLPTVQEAKADMAVRYADDPRRARNSDEFNSIYDAWLAAPGDETFAEHLTVLGWAYTDGRWHSPAELPGKAEA